MKWFFISWNINQIKRNCNWYVYGRILNIFFVPKLVYRSKEKTFYFYETNLPQVCHKLAQKPSTMGYVIKFTAPFLTDSTNLIWSRLVHYTYISKERRITKQRTTDEDERRQIRLPYKIQETKAKKVLTSRNKLAMTCWVIQIILVITNCFSETNYGNNFFEIIWVFGNFCNKENKCENNVCFIPMILTTQQTNSKRLITSNTRCPWSCIQRNKNVNVC